MDYTIFTPILCGIVGYGTNWLAIKMVFRPYEEKRILGFRVPFTPSLIAKDKSKISKKIGNVVAKNLITDSSLLSELKNESKHRILKSKIKETLDCNTDKTLNDLLISITEDNYVFDHFYNKFYNLFDKDYIVINIKNEIIDYFSSEEFFTSIKKNILDNENNISDFILTSFSSENISKKLLSYAENDNFTLVYSDFSINKIFFEKDKNDLYNFLERNLNDIACSLCNFIESEKFTPIDLELENLVKIALKNNLGSLATTFIKPEHIYSKNKQKFIEYIKNEDNNPEILVYLTNTLEKICNYKIADLTSNLTLKENEYFIDKTLNFVLKNTLPTLTGTIFNKIKNTQYDELFMKNLILNLQLDNEIENLIYDKYNYIFEKHFSKEQLKKIKIKDLDINTEYISEICFSFINKNLEQNVSGILKTFNIEKIVENNINNMSIMETEKIILDVAKKELKAITLLGGVLGFIFGLIPLIINKI
ncbi:MAG: DUF445 family protein [Lachnospirales bacterium]